MTILADDDITAQPLGKSITQLLGIFVFLHQLHHALHITCSLTHGQLYFLQSLADNIHTQVHYQVEYSLSKRTLTGLHHKTPAKLMTVNSQSHSQLTHFDIWMVHKIGFSPPAILSTMRHRLSQYLVVKRMMEQDALEGIDAVMMAHPAWPPYWFMELRKALSAMS